jgi:hypothetical protein
MSVVYYCARRIFSVSAIVVVLRVVVTGLLWFVFVIIRCLGELWEVEQLLDVSIIVYIVIFTGTAWMTSWLPCGLLVQQSYELVIIHILV